MATSPRKTTGKAAPTKGAASAVSTTDPETTASAEEKVTVEQDPAITVDAAEPPNEAERELLREAAAGDIAAQQAAAQLGIPVDEGIPAATRLPLDSLPKVTEGVEGQVGAVEQPSAEQMGLRSTRPVPHAVPLVTGPVPPVRDLSVLRTLADTSGADPVTPYPLDNVPAPNPLDLLGPIRVEHDWTRETDDVATARVVADGWRALVNGAHVFAARGDRVLAPSDIIQDAAKYGVVIIEE